MKITIRKRIKRTIRIKSRTPSGECCAYGIIGPYPTLHLAPNPVPILNLLPHLSLLIVYPSNEV